MGYGRYRSWRSRGWRTYRPSKYTELAKLFGSGVNEIKAAFLRLDSDALDELLSDYGEIHGENAESYARRTHASWRSGEVKLSGQTMERLVELVPPYLSASMRLEILKLVLKKNEKTVPTVKISIDVKEPVVGLRELEEELTKMNVTDALAYLPANVMSAASWLYDNDVTAARAMLAEATQAENEILKRNALKEIELLKRTIVSGQVKSAHYTVEMPSGKLFVNVFTPSLFSSVLKFFK